MKKLQNHKELFLMSVFAGLLIGIGGLVYLRVGGIVGAFLFAFGLSCVVMCEAQLFTGKAGFLKKNELLRLLPILFYNVVGCILAGVITMHSINQNIIENLTIIWAARENSSSIVITSIGTGIIMTLAVYGAKQKNYLPLILGVPTFILSGLPHCIADAYYYIVLTFMGKWSMDFVVVWSLAVIGNLIGCNIPRFFMDKKF